MKRLVFTAAATLLVTRLAVAQYIGGHVVETGSGLATLLLHVVARQAKTDVATAVTDSSGNFYLGPLSPGLYRLRFGDGTSAPFLSDTLRVTKDGLAQAQFQYDSSARRPYYEFEVEKSVAPHPGQRAPRYPDALRKDHISGQVLARFVVDTSGRFIEGTFSLLPGSDARFGSAVLDALPGIAFFPAELPNGRKVSQYVHMPFGFSVIAPANRTLKLSRDLRNARFARFHELARSLTLAFR